MKIRYSIIFNNVLIYIYVKWQYNKNGIYEKSFFDKILLLQYAMIPI